MAMMTGFEQCGCAVAGVPDRTDHREIKVCMCSLHKAAPELLAACKELLGFYVPGPDFGVVPIVVRAQAAIAKATE